MENQFKTNLRESKIVETAERIVIDYANCSGREDTNRAAFRGMVTGHLNLLVDSFLSSLEEEVKKLPQEIQKFSGEPAMRPRVILSEILSLIHINRSNYE